MPLFDSGKTNQRLCECKIDLSLYGVYESSDVVLLVIPNIQLCHSNPLNSRDPISALVFRDSGLGQSNGSLSIGNIDEA
jgi:hypothetical protein